jgi:hypothetical protein
MIMHRMWILWTRGALPQVLWIQWWCSKGAKAYCFVSIVFRRQLLKTSPCAKHREGFAASLVACVKSAMKGTTSASWTTDGSLDTWWGKIRVFYLLCLLTHAHGAYYEGMHARKCQMLCADISSRPQEGTGEKETPRAQIFSGSCIPRDPCICAIQKFKYLLI